MGDVMGQVHGTIYRFLQRAYISQCFPQLLLLRSNALIRTPNFHVQNPCTCSCTSIRKSQ